MKQELEVRGTVEVRLYGANGELKHYDKFKNGITTIGFNNIVNGLVSGTINQLTALGIGWGGAAGDPFDAAQTDLLGSSKDKIVSPDPNITISQIDSQNWRIIATWGPGEPSGGSWPKPIEEIGGFWGSASSGTMFSRTPRAVINKDNLDTLEITYNYSIA